MKKKVSSESLVKDIRRQTRRKYSAEEKYGLYWKVFVAKTVLPLCVVARESQLINITVGVKIF